MDEFQKSDRRTFLKIGASLLLTTAFPSLFSEIQAATHKKTSLTILHTNDWHSRIEAFPETDASYAGLGGAEARASLIQKIRSEEEHVLLLDSGDIFQGTPYFNFYGGELEFKLMSKMGYDCATVGNHDFDNGVDGLLKQMPHAQFEFVNCNYDFSASKLSGKIKPYKIFQKGNLKVGVFGVGIELQGLVPEKLYEGVQYRDPVECANTTAWCLKKEERCDLIICLSHLGHQYKDDKVSDKILAARSEHIDIILGGHTHTFLEAPETLLNAVGKPVLINQAGWGGIKMGRIDCWFDKASRKNLHHQSSVQTISSGKI